MFTFVLIPNLLLVDPKSKFSIEYERFNPTPQHWKNPG